MSKIFISYRRNDSADSTGRICDRLIDKFGAHNVLRDIDSIPLGTDFRTHIEDLIGGSTAVLAIIGRDWLGSADPDGKRKLEQAQDYVRIEIQYALEKGIPIIPVLIGNTPTPSPGLLPDSIEALAYRNGISIRPDPDFRHDVDRLIAGLSQLSSAPEHNPPQPTSPEFRQAIAKPQPPSMGKKLAWFVCSIFYGLCGFLFVPVVFIGFASGDDELSDNDVVGSLILGTLFGVGVAWLFYTLCRRSHRRKDIARRKEISDLVAEQLSSDSTTNPVQT